MAFLNKTKQKVLRGNLGSDLITETIKVALLTSTHTTDIDTQEFWADISANEVVGTGYTAGGQTLTGKSVTLDATDDEGVFDADNVTWAASTITARHYATYKDTGNPATSPVYNIYNFGSDKTTVASDFVIQWNAEGIFNLN